ncbi:MAG: hypothetical protein ACT4QF_06070 [Sporichthyaceae bacterium]
MISKETHRTWSIRPRRRAEEEGPWGPQRAAIPGRQRAAQPSAARVELELLDPYVAAQADPLDPEAEAEMEIAWRAYGEVVDVLGAITNAARLAERGVCTDTQLHNIDLLASDLEAAWARWEAAHERVIGRQPGRERNT